MGGLFFSVFAPFFGETEGDFFSAISFPKIDMHTDIKVEHRSTATIMTTFPYTL